MARRGSGTWSAVLRANGLGLILDIVPNHMAVGAGNAWWMDVLRLGQDSPHAKVFDIDWHPDNPLLHGKVLLPVLGRAYGEALEAGEISVGADGFIRYFDNRFPIRPEDGPEVAALGPDGYDQDRLHRLLERQHYRLASWRTANDEINWRRFFDINELIGVRVEDAAVFEATHAALFRLYGDGLIDGVRIDHIDGLADPAGYCRRLRRRLEELAPDRAAYIVVEKILGAGEQLPPDWGVDGTSGYDFMDAVSAMQHDERAADLLGALWHELTGRPAEFPAEEVPARRETLERSFTAQLEACVGALHDAALQDLATRDTPRPALRRALIALLAHFPVYRGYELDPSLMKPRIVVRLRGRGPSRGGPARGDGADCRGAAPARHPGPAACRAAVPAAQCAGDGQVGGGHRVLSVRAADLPQRCGVRCRHAGDGAFGVPWPVRGAGTAVPGRFARHGDA